MTDRSLASIALLSLLVGCSTPAPRVRVSADAPSGWSQPTRAEIVQFSNDPTVTERNLEQAGLAYFTTCHPEPHPTLNTSVAVFARRRHPRVPPAEALDDELSAIAKQRPGVEVRERPTPTRIGGRAAHRAEFTSRGSLLDGPAYVARHRIWLVLTSQGTIVVEAEQPDPPDPECAVGLEATLGNLAFEPTDPAR